jgi:hypothetical protein
MNEEMTCPKCSQLMVRGFIPELSHRASVSFWVEREPESSFWAAGVKLPQDKMINIVTYRCRGCSFL